MPQRVTRLPVLTGLQRRARRVLEAMAKKIRQHEQGLATFKVEAARWQSVVRESARGPRPTPSPEQTRSAKRSPLDWSAILPELPAGFPTTDIAQNTGKPGAQVYTSVSRWMKEKKVKRVQSGYQKV